MTPNVKITNGPNAFDMAVSFFHSTDGHQVRFTFEGGRDIHVIIDSALRINCGHHDYELELFMPGAQAYRFIVRYNCHTRQGELLEVIEQRLETSV